MAGQSSVGTVSLSLSATIKISPSRSELAQAGSSLRLPFDDADKSQHFHSGSNANQINAVLHGRFATGTTIDLKSLTDEFGQAFAFTRINVWFFQNRGADEIEVTGDAGASGETPWADNALKIPGGGHAWQSGCAPDATAWAVSTGTKDVELNLIGSGAAQDVDVSIWGVGTFS